MVFARDVAPEGGPDSDLGTKRTLPRAATSQLWLTRQWGGARGLGPECWHASTGTAPADTACPRSPAPGHRP